MITGCFTGRSWLGYGVERLQEHYQHFKKRIEEFHHRTESAIQPHHYDGSQDPESGPAGADQF